MPPTEIQQAVFETELARRFWERLRLFATRRLGDAALAEDVAQETLRRVVAALRAGKLAHPDALPAFVFQTARNICLHHLRSGGREERALGRLNEGGVSVTGEDALESLISAERRATVRLALERLGESDRDLLRRVYFQQLDSDEIARRLDITPETLRVRKHRALRRLADALGEPDA